MLLTTSEIGLLLFTVAGGMAGVYQLLSRQRVRRLSQERLASGVEEEVEQEARPLERAFARRNYWLPWMLASLGFVICYYAIGIPLFYSLGLGTLLALIAGQVDGFWLEMRYDRIENQLADAIDLMISALKVGTTMQQALELAARDSPRPLKGQLEEVVARIRYGDSPQAVMEGLMQRVPLETFRLFAMTLAVNWNSGGELTPTLVMVAGTIRDRIELARRLKSATAQARASVISVICVTYFILALMWRNDPQRTIGFLTSYTGELLTAGAMVLQGIGVVWITWLSKPRF